MLRVPLLIGGQEEGMEETLHQQLARLSSQEVVELFKKPEVPRWLRYAQRVWAELRASVLSNDQKLCLFANIVDFCGKAFPVRGQEDYVPLRRLVAIAIGSVERRFTNGLNEPKDGLEYDMAFFTEYARSEGQPPPWFV